MTELWAAIALLLCVNSGFVLWAWWRPLPTSNKPDNRNEAVVALYRLKQVELEQELASAQINRSDYDQNLAEMQRTLLLETSATKASLATAPTSPNQAGGFLLLLVAMVIPVAGLLTYFEIGAHERLEQSFNIQNTRNITAAATSLPVLIDSLENELKHQANNPEGWYLLANSYMQAEQPAKGIAAFEKALSYVQAGSRQYASLLGQYAQALFFSDGEFSQRVKQAIADTMAQNPLDVSALSLLGIQAYENESYDAAIQFWQRALPSTGEGQGKASLQAGIASAQRMLNENPRDDLGISLPIRVSLANGLSIPMPEQAVLFVYAQQGQQVMPLFATKLDPKNLPLELMLTDAMALQGSNRLADYKTLNLSAHIAMAGVPGKKAGDLVSRPLVIDVAEISSLSGDKTVNLTIDKILN